MSTPFESLNPKQRAMVAAADAAAGHLRPQALGPGNSTATDNTVRPNVSAQPGDHAIVRAWQANAKKRIRQKSGPKMNKLEAAFLENLKQTIPAGHHYAQAITFSLANGCRFTPDFVTLLDFPKMIIAWETKGPFARDDSIVKLKVAAAMYPEINFKLVSRHKSTGGWSIEEVLP